MMGERNETKAILSFIITDQDEELMEPWGYTIAAVVLFFIGFFGFFLNIFVIILMCRDLQVSRILFGHYVYYYYLFICLN